MCVWMVFLRIHFPSNLFLLHFTKIIVCNKLEVKKEGKKKKKTGPSSQFGKVCTDLSNTKNSNIFKP